MGKTEKKLNRNTNDEKDIPSTKQSQATKNTFQKKVKCNV